MRVLVLSLFIFLILGCISQEQESTPIKKSELKDYKNYLLDGLTDDFQLKTVADLYPDVNICKSIKDQSWKDNCYLSVASSLNDTKICNLIKSDVSEACTTIVEGDETKFINQNFYFFYAKRKKDITLCDESDNTALCIQEISFLLNESKLCDEIEDAYMKGMCYANFAERDGNLETCDKINHKEVKDNCISRVGIRMQDTRICNNADKQKDMCIAMIAIATNNPNMCYKAESEKEFCLDNVAE